MNPCNPELQLCLYNDRKQIKRYDYDNLIYDVDEQIKLLSSRADNVDYLVAAGSGILCAILDILWVGDFKLDRGIAFSTHKAEGFVKKVAKCFGCKSDDLTDAVRYLEKMFPIPSDGNTPEFGGGRQHHMRDFAHHPTIVGLIFSLLTQFTGKSFGTDTKGYFMIVDVPERSRLFIGKTVPEKVLFGTVFWFFHLVSDMAGSSASAALSGGTGIPGPILSLAKELSALPVMSAVGKDDLSLSVFLSKLFNGTLLMRRDANGKIIPESVTRIDLRAEMGIGTEIARQAIPVVANECIVRSFYMIRRLSKEIKKVRPLKIEDFRKIEWREVCPANNPTIDRMLTIATGVFVTLDIGEAVVTQKYWLGINYPGVARFVLAVGKDVSWGLRRQSLKEIRKMYKNIQRFTFTKADAEAYEKIGKATGIKRFSLTQEQTEVLFNLEYQMTKNDTQRKQGILGSSSKQNLKTKWLHEWWKYISIGFPDFVGKRGAKLHLYSETELVRLVERLKPSETWFRLVLLEAMVFEPYYPIAIEKDKNGEDIPSSEYNEIKGNFDRSYADSFLDSFFTGKYYQKGYIKRLRRSYAAALRELSGVSRMIATSAIVTVIIATICVAFTPGIAVFLVGSHFPGLSGVAMTNACLAYLGGGALAAGGFGMAGGTAVVIGGGSVLGIGVGIGAGSVVNGAQKYNKEYTILQTAKLMTALKEIFLADEKNVEYSVEVSRQLAKVVAKTEKDIVELEVHMNSTVNVDKKRKMKKELSQAKEVVKVLSIAQKNIKLMVG